MTRLQQSILLISLANIALSNPLFPVKFDADRIDRYNPLIRLMDALCIGFETSFCRDSTTPTTINHIAPAVSYPTPLSSSQPQINTQRSLSPTTLLQCHLCASPQISRTTATSSTVVRLIRFPRNLQQSKNAVSHATTPEIVSHGRSIQSVCNARISLRHRKRRMGLRARCVRLGSIRGAMKRCLGIQSWLAVGWAIIMDLALGTRLWAVRERL